MMKIHSVEDVYPALDEIIAHLRTAGQAGLASLLHQRLHEIAWTTRSELIEELHSVLTQALKADRAHLPDSVAQQMEQVLRAIENELRS